MNQQARNINNLLDEYNQLKKKRKSKKNTTDLNNKKEELSELISNTTSVKDMFTNQYYINDIYEDRRCSK
jgi:alcohol dehydrogenase class IV